MKLVFFEPITDLNYNSDQNKNNIDSGNENSFITAPIAVYQDITVFLNGAGNATITTADVDRGSSDPDVDYITLSISQSSFNCSNIVANTITLTVTDTNESVTSTYTATVTVVDNTPPTAGWRETTDYS